MLSLYLARSLKAPMHLADLGLVWTFLFDSVNVMKNIMAVYSKTENALPLIMQVTD